MNDFGNPIRMVRELEGPALSIFMALALVHQRVSQSWLEMATGYTDKPVSQALAYLKEVGLASHTSAGWQLTGKAQQLPLANVLESGEQETDSTRQIATEDIEDGAPVEEVGNPVVNEVDDGNSDQDSRSRKVSDSIINNKDLESINKDSINNNSGSRNFSDSLNNHDPPERREKLIQTLLELGILPNARTQRIFDSEWLTAEDVQVTYHKLKKRYSGGYNEALLIGVLESTRPYSIKHAWGCTCARCQSEAPNRYQEWEDGD